MDEQNMEPQVMNLEGLTNNINSTYITEQPVAPVMTVDNNDVQINEQPYTLTVLNTETQNISQPSIQVNEPVIQVQELNTVVPPVVTNSVNTTEQVQEVTQEANEPVLVKGKIIVSASKLKNLVNSARKVGIADGYIVVSQVLDIEFGPKGIIVKTSNGQEDYVCVDTEYIFDTTIHAFVDISLFSDLVNALDDEEIEFRFDEEHSVLQLITSTGGFKFPEMMDPQTEKPIEINPKFTKPYEEMQPVDISKLMQTLNFAKPIRDEAKANANMLGMWFSDIIICTDRTLILMKENLSNLKDYKFFLPGVFCDLLQTIAFDPNNTRCGTVLNEAQEVVAFVVSDGKITLSGPVSSATSIPLDSCYYFWNAQFNDSAVLDTKKCLSVLKRVKPFVRPGTDKDSSYFSVEGNSLEVISLNGDAVDTISADKNKEYSFRVKLPIFKLISILSAISCPTFKLTVDSAEERAVCLEFDDFKCIVGISNDR